MFGEDAMMYVMMRDACLGNGEMDWYPFEEVKAAYFAAGPKISEARRKLSEKQREFYNGLNIFQKWADRLCHGSRITEPYIETMCHKILGDVLYKKDYQKEGDKIQINKKMYSWIKGIADLKEIKIVLNDRQDFIWWSVEEEEKEKEEEFDEQFAS